jgi:hypothetical protein
VTTMECPATGCQVAIPLHRFGCPRHWRMLSKALQQRVWARWNHDSRETYDELVDAAQIEWAGR